MGTLLSDPTTARQLAEVDEFWFGPSAKGAGLSAGRAGPSLSGLRVGGRKAPNRLVAALAAGLVVVLVAAFFVVRMSGGAEGRVFRYALTQGEKRTYDLSMTMSGAAAAVPNAPPIEGQITGTLGYEVVATEPDGSSTIELTLENLRMDPPSGTLPSGASKMRVKIAPDGSITGIEGTGGVLGATGAGMNSALLPQNPSDGPASQFMFPQFPDDKIAPGASWSEDLEVPLPFGDDAIKVHVAGSHVGLEDSKYGQVAKFHHTITSPLDVRFTFAELFEAMGEALGGSAGDIPAEARDAAMVISGKLNMVTDTLVVPDTTDLVRLDATIDMDMRMTLEGVPPSAGAPEDVAIDMIMKVVMIRTDGTQHADDAAADGAPADSAPATVPDPGADPVPGSDSGLGTDLAPPARTPGYGDDPVA
jgi:hypothetical protein